MEIIQYSHYRKFTSQPRYVLTYDVPLFSLRFIAVLVNYEQSESMHDVWCLLCIFRVSFYWAEADDAGGKVSVSLTEQISPFHRCMRGTNQKNPRCGALAGPPPEKTHIALFTKTVHMQGIRNVRRK